MKKILPMMAAAFLILSLAACGNTAESAQTAETAAETKAVEETAAGEAGASVTSGSDIDVDLTAMSGTMVYSEVLNMQQTPEKYLGKTVKMKGLFNVTTIDDKHYFACIIADATACCSTGIEFDLAGEHQYPSDYPKPQTEITVVGTFTTYTEGSSKYLQLKDAEIVS